MPRSTPILLEPLEPRLFLSGVTIITHGYELSGTMPNWVNTMATAVATEEGGASIYKMTMGVSQSTPVVSTFVQLSGPDPRTSANGEIVIELDWAAETGLFLFLIPDYTTTQIASAVVPFLLNPIAGTNLGGSLAQLPFHLIGHSRGGSLVSEMARLLGQSGVWVDQMTTLDPHPVSPDPIANPTSNVLFADNYYETSATPNGSAVTGAYNLNLTSVNPGHSGTHAYYYGSMNLTATNDGDGTNISSSWYVSPLPARDNTGYLYSRIIGAPRPTSGIGVNFGGSGARLADAAVGSQWANIGALSVANTTINAGTPQTVAYQFEDRDSSATIHWYLDTDQNPYDATEIPLGTTAQTTTGDSVGNFTATFTPTTNQAGTYYLLAVAEDGTHARVAYTSTTFTIAPAPGLLGDANLDGLVNIDDYLALDHGYLHHLTGWANGDFSGNGTIDAADYALLDQAFGTQHPTSADTFSQSPQSFSRPSDFLSQSPSIATFQAAPTSNPKSDAGVPPGDPIPASSTTTPVAAAPAEPAIPPSITRAPTHFEPSSISLSANAPLEFRESDLAPFDNSSPSPPENKLTPQLSYKTIRLPRFARFASSVPGNPVPADRDAPNAKRP